MEATANKVSGSAILEHFTKLNDRLDRIERYVLASFVPKPLLLYKPHMSDFKKGAALRINYKATIEAGQKGLFLDIAAQRKDKDENGNARFYWRTENDDAPEGLEQITTKFGLPDIQRLLLGYTFKRSLNQPTPKAIRSITKNGAGKWEPEAEGVTVGLTHKFADDTTIVEWKFNDDGSYLRIIQLPAKRSRSISLTLAEELSFVLYLTKAHEAFLDVGVR